MTGAALVVQGDALRLPLADESVDLIVSSPPFFALRSYRDGDEHFAGQIGSEPTPADFLRALWAVMDECWRVLKPTGVAVINLGEKYAGTGGANGNTGLGFTDDKSGKADPRSGPRNNTKQTSIRGEARAKSVMGLPWRFALGLSIPDPYRTCYDPGDHPQWINRRPLCWDKPNGLPESVTDRPRASSEDWFILTKQGRYFSAIDEIREPQSGSHVGYKGADYGRAAQGRHDGYSTDPDLFNPLGKLPGSVWQIPSEPLLVPEWAKKRYDLPDHFAAFPQEWPRRLILAFSPNGICENCRRPIVERNHDAEQNPKRPISESCKDNRGVYRLRDGGRATGLRSSGQEHGGLPSIAASGSADSEDYRRSDEVRRAVPTVPHAETLGGGDLQTAERQKASSMLLREAIDGEGDVQNALHTVAETRQPSRRAQTGTETCDCVDPPTRPSVVLDPFSGTGTTIGVAKALGRIGIGIDLSYSYCRLARWRVEQSGHFSKALNRSWSERQGALL